MKALILVDIQKDFLPGGALAVPHGDEVVPVANRLIGNSVFDLVIASKDWHPPNHVSFAEQHEGKRSGDVIDLNGFEQILWPAHCVRDTSGAEFAPGLHAEQTDKIVLKGDDREIDSYSAFFDNGHRKTTGLGDYLKEHDVTEVYLVGLATDVCVKFTALDARALGLETFVIEDGCRGVDLKPGDVQRAFEEMRQAGVQIIPSTRLSE